MNGRMLLRAFSYIDDDWLSYAEGHAAKTDREKPRPFRLFASLAAVLALLIAMGIGAWAFREFSSLDGDDLSLSAHYEGAGIISINVENLSDTELRFKPKIKLQRWSTSEEVPRIADHIEFSNLEVRAGEKEVVRIDLSKAYDLDALENPLEDDWYVLILTNRAFLFGHDWMCSIDFSEPSVTEKAEPSPLPPVVPAAIMEQLRPYFEIYAADPAELNSMSAEYLTLCRELLRDLDGTVVSPVCPRSLTIKEPEEETVFDPSVPPNRQLQLTGLHARTVDGYEKIVGAADTEEALVLSVQIPQHEGEIDGVDIPLIFVFTYNRNTIKSSQDYAFIRGQLLTFDQMEKYRIYADSQFVCYNVTDLFYSDLKSYVESMVSQRSDVYYDEQIFLRVQNVYTYYTLHLPELIRTCVESERDESQGMQSEEPAAP